MTTPARPFLPFQVLGSHFLAFLPWSNQSTPFSISSGGALAISDVNGDAVDDVLIGVSDVTRWVGAQDYQEAGIAVIASGANGAILRTHEGLDGFGYFGASVAVLGDTDSDGYSDYAIGEPGETAYGDYLRTGDVSLNAPCGAVHVYSGRTGNRLATRLGGIEDEVIGYSLRATADMNGDGIADLYCGFRGRRIALVVSPVDLATIKEMDSVEFIGSGLLGDLDDKGGKDRFTIDGSYLRIVSSETKETIMHTEVSESAASRGRVHVLSLANTTGTTHPDRSIVIASAGESLRVISTSGKEVALRKASCLTEFVWTFVLNIQGEPPVVATTSCGTDGIAHRVLLLSASLAHLGTLELRDGDDSSSVVRLGTSDVVCRRVRCNVGGKQFSWLVLDS